MAADGADQPHVAVQLEAGRAAGPGRSPTPDPSSNTTTPAAECYITGRTIVVAGGQVLLESMKALRA